MSAFCEDDTKFGDHLTATSNSLIPDSLPLRVLEWASQTPGHELLLPSAAALISREQSLPCPLRVVFAPYRARETAEIEGLNLLFHHYSFPSATMSGRIQSVTHSFGARQVLKGCVDVAWTHFLCKSLQAQWVDFGGKRLLRIVDDGVLRDKQSHANSSWITSDFFIHVRRGEDGHAVSVTLLCFGASNPLLERFRRLLQNPSWEDAVREPYVLMDIVYDELYIMFDNLAWKLADVFRPMERWVLDGAQKRRFFASDLVDFTGLHNVSKHCTYLNEAAEAARLTLDSMTAELETGTQVSGSQLLPGVIASLKYRKSMFQSSALRLKSLEKRIANTISLSFNLVAQQDSRVMQNDSSAMKAIAVMTLVFLPATGVASIFSSPFFNVDFGSTSRQLQVAACIWIFWVIVLPLTAAIFFLWLWLYTEAKLRTSGTARSRWKNWSPSDLIRRRQPSGSKEA